MKVLLDTNIIIHREGNNPAINKGIGVLFNWLAKLKYEKCIHKVIIEEIRKHKDSNVVKIMDIKNYNLLCIYKIKNKYFLR